MNFKNIFLGAAAAVALVGCQKSNDSAPAGRPVGAQQTLTEDGSYAKGAPAYSFEAAGRSMSVDGTSVDPWSVDVLNSLASSGIHVRALTTVTRAVETTDQVLELYSGDTLVLAIDLKNDNPTVIYTNSGFQADSISYMRNAAGDDGMQGQGMATSSVLFNLRECAVEEPVKGEEQEQAQGKFEEPVKGQEQAQGKAEEPVKGEEQEQAQGKLEEPVKGQEQAQGKAEEPIKGEEQEQAQGKIEEPVKGQEQVQEKAPDCRIVTFTLHFNQIQEKAQEQAQEKVEEPVKGQEQAQGKAEEPVKGQEQLKD